MASLGDFSSLLQLGVGIGIGLSLFRAPVDLRVNSLSKVLEEELTALANPGSDFGRVKRRDLSDLKLDFLQVRDELERSMIPFMIAAVTGAALNLIVLIDGTLHSDIEITTIASVWLIFVSVGFFLMELAMLEILARRRLGAVSKKLALIRARRDVQLPIPLGGNPRP